MESRNNVNTNMLADIHMTRTWTRILSVTYTCNDNVLQHNFNKAVNDSVTLHFGANGLYKEMSSTGWIKCLCGNVAHLTDFSIFYMMFFI